MRFGVFIFAVSVVVAIPAKAVLPPVCAHFLTYGAKEGAGVYAGADQGECIRNIRRLLGLFELAEKDGYVSLDGARVLFLQRPVGLKGVWIPIAGWRGGKTFSVEQHTVLLMPTGDVIDSDSGDGTDVLPLAEYAAKKLGAEVPRLQVAAMDVRTFLAHYPLLPLQSPPLEGDALRVFLDDVARAPAAMLPEFLQNP